MIRFPSPRPLVLSALGAALLLTGCYPFDDSSAGGATPAAAPTTTVTVTPSLGRISNAHVLLHNARTNALLDTQPVMPDGRARFKIPTSVDSIVVEIAPDSGGTYFDEAKGDQRSLPSGFTLRAAAPVSGDVNLGVTVLTDAAVKLAETLPGALTDPANITQAVGKIGQVVGVSDINQPPTPVGSTADLAALTDSAADRYALQLAGLVQAAAAKTTSDTPALELADKLSRDLSDGQVDGKAGTQDLGGQPYSPLPAVFAEAWKFGMQNVLGALPDGDVKTTLQAQVVDTTAVKDNITSPVVTGGTDFGDTSGKWKGEIYLLDVGTPVLPDFSAMTPIGSLYTDVIDISPRSFTEPFPGVPSDRFEWFGVRYQGPLTVNETGDYDLQTLSDDGSKLYIDDVLVINNDGQHPPSYSALATVNLSKGVHTLRIEYFQGPATQIALQVFGNKHGQAQALLHPVL